MAYRWKQGETIPAGARRIAVEQIAKALGHLEMGEGSREAHIHEARKSMKRLRGLVRLTAETGPTGAAATAIEAVA